MTKKDEKYISNLRSGNQQLITETFEQIREEGSTSLLPYLFDLLNTSLNEEIKKQVYSVLCELKRTESVPILMEAITSEKYSGIQELLLKVCWENGLDYTPYLSTFVDIVIKGSFMNAFEAFTVIENMEGPFNTEETKRITDKLTLLIEEMTNEKKSLVLDLIKILH